MADPSSFVYLVDRYLEVSNVYHLRMAADVLSEDDASEAIRLTSSGSETQHTSEPTPGHCQEYRQ